MTNLASSLAAMVASRNTWQAHANTAYDSGVWGTGNTWQTDYNTVLPPTSVVQIEGVSNNVPLDGAYHNNLSSITFTRTGQWVVIFRAGLGNAYFDGYVNGVLVLSNISANRANNPEGSFWQGTVTSGQEAHMAINGTGGGTMGTFVDAFFIPTQANAH